MKWKDLLTKKAWDLNEIKNQLIHVIVGAIAFLFFNWLINSIILSLLLVLLMAIIIETTQYFFFDNRRLKLPDRVRDIIFYILGALFILV